MLDTSLGDFRKLRAITITKEVSEYYWDQISHSLERPSKRECPQTVPGCLLGISSIFSHVKAHFLCYHNWVELASKTLNDSDLAITTGLLRESGRLKYR